MGEEPKYMGGQGILQETARLTDLLWDRFLTGLAGICTMALAPIAAYAVFISRLSWDPPITNVDIACFVGVSGIGIVAGVFIANPWFKASRALRTHTKRLKKETAVRGRGWASS